MFKHNRASKIAGILVGLLLVAAGYIVLQLSAAGFFAATDPEQATISGNAKVVDDTSALGGKAVIFTAPTATPPPPPPPPPTSGSCPNAQHTPGGPDGFGGCWPYANPPANDKKDWLNWSGNVGVPAGTVLSAYTGPCTITTANTVIDKKTINCALDIRAQNVTITNSKITGRVMIDSNRCGSASFTISDSNIHEPDINFRGLMVCSYTANRVIVSGGQSMAWCDTCTIRDSFLHHPLEDPTGAAANHGAHNSTVRISKFATLYHNTLWCVVKEYSQPDGQDTSGCSANQTGYSHDGAPPYNSTMERNLYMPTSGGYCAYGGSTTGELSKVHDIVFKDNVFKRTAFLDPVYNVTQGGPKCGFWGPVSDFDSSRPGNQWINNKWDDGTVVPPAD